MFRRWTIGDGGRTTMDDGQVLRRWMTMDDDRVYRRWISEEDGRVRRLWTIRGAWTVIITTSPAGLESARCSTRARSSRETELLRRTMRWDLVDHLPSDRTRMIRHHRQSSGTAVTASILVPWQPWGRLVDEDPRQAVPPHLWLPPKKTSMTLTAAWRRSHLRPRRTDRSRMTISR